jgi:hypothetical protein
LATTAAAQEPTAALRLTQTGRVFACGDGAAQRCLISRDSSRALSIGADRDMVWWHVPERRALRHFDPPGERYQEPWLHPELPFAVWVAADGSGQRIDLDSDRREALSKQQVEALQPRAGLDWRRGGQPLSTKTDAVTPDGKHRLVFRGNLWSRKPSTFQSAYGEAHWLADDGTVLTARGTKFEVHGLRFGERSSTSLHSGPPQQLSFTPDGNHLAVVSLTSVQIVDSNGSEIARLPGPRIVQPGEGPDEFWVVANNGMQRWSATTRNEVGQQVPIDPTRGVPWMEPFRVDSGGKLKRAFVHQGTLWADRSAGVFRSSELLRDLTNGEGLDTVSTKRAIGEILFPRETLFALVADQAIPSTLFLNQRDGAAVLRRIAAGLVPTPRVEFLQSPNFLVATNSGLVGVGLADGTLQIFEGTALQVVQAKAFDLPLKAAVPIGKQQLLATNGRSLLHLEGRTLEVLGEIALPNDVSSVDQLVASPDGRRLAISCGSDVRILTIE